MNFDFFNVNNDNNNNNNNSNESIGGTGDLTIAAANDEASTIDALSFVGLDTTPPRNTRPFKSFFSFGSGSGNSGGGGGWNTAFQPTTSAKRVSAEKSPNNSSDRGTTNNGNNNGNNNNNNNKKIEPIKSDKVAVDDLLSTELLKLNLGDRTATDEEIHGVRCMCPKETPEMRQRALWSFQHELDDTNGNSSITYQKKKIYLEIVNSVSWQRQQNQQQPQQQPPPQQQHYVMDDPKFRLRFLRCELFDVRKAVTRFLNYLNFVSEVWGYSVVSRHTPIGLGDFTKSELKYMKRGLNQILPFRDRSGRRVIIVMGGMGSPKELIARAKCYFFIWYAATIDDVESQRKGAVSITHQSAWSPGITMEPEGGGGSASSSGGSVSSSEGKGGREGSNKSTSTSTRTTPKQSGFQVPHKELKMVNDIFASIPTRITANHNLYPDTAIFRFISKLIMVSVVSGANLHNQRLRQKFHFGDEIELRYQLQGFGIPINLIPSTETGTVKLHNFNQWMKTRQLLEETNNEHNNSAERINQYTYTMAVGKKGKKNKATTTITVTNTIVECPGSHDVIFRRGQSFKEHPGNDMFRDSIMSYLTEKEEAMQQQFMNNTTTTTTTTTTTKEGGKDNNTSTSSTTTTSSPTAIAKITATQVQENKDHDEQFCQWLLQEIQAGGDDDENNNGRQQAGRFLEWDQELQSWIQMVDVTKIKRKISVSLYNYEKRYSSSLRRQAHQRLQQQVMVSVANDTNNNNSGATALMTRTATKKHTLISDNSDENGAATTNMAYCFIEGGEPSSAHKRNNGSAAPNKFCGMVRFDNCINYSGSNGNSSGNGTSSGNGNGSGNDSGNGNGSYPEGPGPGKKARTHSFDE